jgi:hypothetical protein
VRLELTLDGTLESVPINTVIIAGWTGRDRGAVEEHMAELERMGVPRPSTAPVFYRASASRLTTVAEVEATAESTGEVEAVLLRHEGRVFVGVGSDLTDRAVETYSVAVSKQLCDKPIGSDFWAYDEVDSHWDQLVVRSWIDDDILYQEGKLSALLYPDELLRLAEPGFMDGTVIFCGTLPVIGGIRRAESFRYELADPVFGRSIGARYEMRELPLVS